MTEQPWSLGTHPSGLKTVQRAGRSGVYYFPAGPETVTDALVGDLNALESRIAELEQENAALRERGLEASASGLRALLATANARAESAETRLAKAVEALRDALPWLSLRAMLEPGRSPRDLQKAHDKAAAVLKELEPSEGQG